jgi:P27 family predicted phage terminase small subunit
LAGRNRQPLSVIQGKGRSHHISKAEAKRRKEQEERIKGFIDNIEPPSYLTQKQKKEFTKIANELIRLGILSNLDVDFLARYIDSKTEYEKITKELRKIKKPTESEEMLKIYTELRINRNTFYNECKAAASELGLSITSRLKLVIPKTEEREKTEFEKKFGDI